MKKVTVILLLAAILAGSCLPSAMAATVLERIDRLEELLGTAAPGGTVEDRLSHLEAQLGLQKQAGRTLEDRLRAVEDILGAPAGTETAGRDRADAAVRIGVSQLEPFTRDGVYVITDSGQKRCTDNYGDVYTEVMVADGHGEESSIEFFLDGGYSTLEGVWYVTQAARDPKNVPEDQWKSAAFSVYGDDVLLFRKQGGLDNKSRPEAFEVDIRGVSFLKITIENTCHPNGYLACLGNVMLTQEN